MVCDLNKITRRNPKLLMEITILCGKLITKLCEKNKPSETENLIALRIINNQALREN